MGLLSSTTSITCYRVEGKIAKPVAETVHNCLKKNLVPHIDGQPGDKAVGWASFEQPYSSKIVAGSFLFGAAMIFSLRIDKKTIPASVIKKYCDLEAERQAANTGRKPLSKNEKKTIKEKVLQDLAVRVPATPKVYDLAWHYEQGRLWFFSNLKSANEELETLFTKTFSLRLIRLFPYTIATLESDLSDSDQERLIKMPPSQFN
ncbi:MAG: recombination-associated protein RdgC [Thermodesulfobacteriota bacterium]